MCSMGCEEACLAKRVENRSAPVVGTRARVPSWIPTARSSRSHAAQKGS
jgi:hypothetical protein